MNLAQPGVALVVDDEPLVRTLLSAVLRRCGWTVIEAADARAALELAPEKLGLLVTDLQMPAVSGVALAQALRARHGMLPIVLVSGASDAEAQMASLLGPRTVFVPKPFPVEELIARIAAVTA
jgi:DNA-binding response OmpR family regulator